MQFSKQQLKKVLLLLLFLYIKETKKVTKGHTGSKVAKPGLLTMPNTLSSNTMLNGKCI